MIVRQTLKKQVAGNEFDIDYMGLVLATKYKILRTKTAIEDKIKSSKELQGYICPKCSKEYNALDVDQVLNLNSGLLECEDCAEELEQNVKDQVSDEKLVLFMKQITPIRETLQQLDKMDLPSEWYSTSTLLEYTESPNIHVQVDLKTSDDTNSPKLKEKRIENTIPLWHQASTIVKGTKPHPTVASPDDDDSDEFEEV